MEKIPSGLKGSVVREREAGHYLVRIRMPAGLTNANELEGIVRVAKDFGLSDIHISPNQTVEFLHVTDSYLPALTHALAENGTPIDNPSRNMLTLLSCSGASSCPHALIETFPLAKELESCFMSRANKIKVRLAVSGCPNSCMNERESEIGITGIRKPLRDTDECMGCGSCIQMCREKALTIVDGKIVMDESRCLLCGLCLFSCPYHCISYSHPAYLISFGGKIGRRQRTARALCTAKSQSDVVVVVGEIIDCITSENYSSSHFTHALTDTEFKSMQETLLNNLEEKGVTVELPPKSYL